MLLLKKNNFQNTDYPFLDNYKIIEKIAHSPLGPVFKGLDTAQSPKKELAIKILNTESVSKHVEDIAHYKDTLRKVQILNNSCIINIYDFAEQNNHPYIISEYIPGENLTFLLHNAHEYSIEYFINLFITICKTVNHFHEKGILHRDLKPSNIIHIQNGTKSTSQRLKIIDFGLSYIKDLTIIKNKKYILNTLLYMSPEICGVIPATVDQRSDLYSLGILFFHLITGRAPFNEENESSLIYQHAAIIPKDPIKHRPDIPPTLSKLILKLLEKNPLNRYNSGLGVLNDLSRLKAGARSIEIEDLDNVKKQIIFRPQMIGREKELEILCSQFTSIQQGQGCIYLIEGETGIGKTRLAEEFKGAVYARGSCFISGKFYEENLKPYSALIDATDSYTQLFHLYNDKKKQLIKTKLKSTIKNVGHILIRFNPLLKAIIDKPDLPGELSLEQNRNIFQRTIITFLKEISLIENGLVLFFDDLQWARQEDIELLSILCQELGNSQLFILAASRIGSVHTKLIKKKFKKNVIYPGGHYKNLRLNHLSLPMLRTLIANILLTDTRVINNIAEDIMEKSKGNPFFAMEILKQLLKSNIIKNKNNKWLFDRALYKKTELSSDIIEIIMQRAADLNQNELNIISIASIIGKQFNIALLFKISDLKDEELIRIIDKAIFLRILEKSSTNKHNLVFVHDRIREAFYNRIPENDRKKYHFLVAKALESLYANSIESVIFDVTFNYIKAEKEVKVLEYLIPAGIASIQKYAYNDAREFFVMALALLNKKKQTGSPVWKECAYKLLDIYLITDYNDKAIVLAQKLLGFTNSIFEQAKVYRYIMEAYFKKGNLSICEKMAYKGMRYLGEHLPLSPTSVFFHLAKEFTIHILHRFLPPLLYRKKLRDPKKKTLNFNYYYTITNVYVFSNPIKMVRNILRILNLAECQKNTETKELAAGLLGFGIINLQLYKYKTAYKYLNRGLQLAHKMNDKWHIGKALYFFAIYYHCRGDYEKALESSRKSILLFEETGDNLELMLSFSILVHSYIKMGKYFEIEELVEVKQLIVRTDSDFVKSGFYGFYLTAYLFAGEYAKAARYGKEALDIDKKSGQIFNCCASHIHLGLLYMELGDIDTCFLHLNQAKKILKEKQFINEYINHFYNYMAEALIARYKKDQKYYNSKKRAKELKHIRRACRQALLKTEKLPSHYGAALRAMAKYSTLCKKDTTAEKYFLQSINHYIKYNIKYEYAKSLFDYGMYLKEKNEEEASYNILYKSYMVFKEIKSKVYMERLERDFNIGGSNLSHRLMDRQRITSIKKISQDISSILNINTLLKNILQRVMVATGAQRSCIYIFNKQNNKLENRAMNNMSNRSLPVNIVNIAFKYKKYLIAHNAVQDKDFKNYPEVIRNGLKSILCLPLLYHNQKIGVLYMDSPITENLFIDRDIELLTVFANQAAIAIENAQLYQKHHNLMQQIRKLNEEKEEQRNQLIHADKMISLGVLASSVAHDISNPAGTIAANISFLLQYYPHIIEQLNKYLTDSSAVIGDLPFAIVKDKFNQGLNGIQICTEHIRGIIEGLRNFYKQNETNLDEDVVINNVVLATISILSTELEKTKIKPKLSLTENLPEFKGNFQQLEQVLVNLIINACQALKEKANLPREKKKLYISTGFDHIQKEIKIIVEDNGIGIDKPLLKKITTPFFTTRDKGGGTGLGLSISKKIIQNHNGKLSIVSEKGKGTEVRIEIPIKKEFI